jgi:hypothetical protein
VLGIQPWQGRLILPEDEASACESPRAVVSYPFWQAQMGGRGPGTTLVIDGKPAEVSRSYRSDTAWFLRDGRWGKL